MSLFSKTKSTELISQSKNELEEFRDTLTVENGMRFVKIPVRVEEVDFGVSR